MKVINREEIAEFSRAQFLEKIHPYKYFVIYSISQYPINDETSYQFFTFKEPNIYHLICSLRFTKLRYFNKNFWLFENLYCRCFDKDVVNLTLYNEEEFLNKYPEITTHLYTEMF